MSHSRTLLINDALGAAASLTVGLIADTHMPGTVDRLWQQVHDGFAHVDCILHAGDLHTAAVIEELDSIAPTYVCRGNGDLDVRHERLADHWLGSLGGLTVGLVHKFPTPRRASVAKLNKKLDQHFGGVIPRVVIYGHTHLAELHHVEHTTYINPGSATLPNNQSTRLGTLGLMHIERGSVSVELFQITEQGLTLLEL